MWFRPHISALLTACIALGAVVRAAAAPLFTLSEDGRSFLYHSRPGENPGTVAEMFGIPAKDIGAFLAANGIHDPTRVGSDFVYRIPNPVATAAEAAVADNARLTREATEAAKRVAALERETAETRAAQAAAEARASRLDSFEWWWPIAKAAVVLLALAAAGACALAVAALRRQQRAHQFVRNLTRELEERKRVALAERQEGARRVIELE